MIQKASIVLSVALCVLSLPKERRPAVAKQKLELNFGGHHGDLAHIGHQKPEHHEGYAWTYPSYEFSYKVDDPHTHDKKAQHEERNGGDVTGNYWLIQPDGEKRYIRYHVDDESGFTAVINYTSPHSSVYYNVMKHREDTDKKGEEKGKEEQKDTLQEGGDQKREEGKKDENKGKQGDKLNDENRSKEGGEDKQQNLKIISHDKNHRDDEYHKDRHDDRRGNYDKKGGRGGENNRQGSHPESRDDDRNVDRDGDRGSSRDSNRDSDQKTGHDEENRGEQHKSGKGIPKSEKQEDHDLWASLKGWTIIHDRSKNQEKPVWESDIDNDHYWPGPHSWNDKRDSETLQVDEKRLERGEKIQGINDEKRSSGEEKRSNGEDKPRRAEHRQVDYRKNQSKNEEKQSSVEVKKRLGGESRGHGEQNRKNNDEKQKSGEDIRESRDGRWEEGRDRQRGGEDRRGGMEERWRDGEKRRRDDMRRGDKERPGQKQHRNQGDRRGQPSYVHYTPIAYAQRY